MNVRLTAWMLIFCFFLLTASLKADDQLLVGVAETDITPPQGFPMAGYYHERLATGTHDPLKAKAIVFRSGSQQAALVVCDLTGIAIDLTTEVRRQASATTGIPADNIILSATHSHTAPDYTKDLYEYLDGDPNAPEKKNRYASRLISGIVEAIEKAASHAQAATIEIGIARQESPVSFNRRFVMNDGSVRTWMRLDNPDVLRAAGPIDPDIGLALVRSAADRKPLGLLSNFALHLDTVGGTVWSADYPFHIEQSVRTNLGSDVVSIFGTGCCGDINHVDPVSKERNKTDFIGSSLASTIQSQLSKLRPIQGSQLRVLRSTVSLPLQDVSEEQIARAHAILPAAKAGKQTEFFELVTAYKSIMLGQLRGVSAKVPATEHISWGLTHTWAGIGDHLPVDVQVITIGKDLAIVCLPGEVFVDLGLAIKRASPFATTLVIELSNCVETVYIPTRVSYAAGSYEVTNSTTKPGSGEMLAEAAVALLRQAAEGDEKK